MKKIIMVLSCILFLTILPSAVSISLCEKNNSIEKISADPEEAPNWATGNFTGVWGIDILGHDIIPIGIVQGYHGRGFHGELKFGRFLIDYTENGKENGTQLEGLFFGPFLLGKSTDMATENSTAFVGIGGYNETHFNWRIMGMSGPTLFMKGTFSNFE